MNSQIHIDWDDNFDEIQHYQAALKILQGTKQLIHAESLWCQGVGARASDGLPVHYSDKDACQFCLSYAYKRALSLPSLGKRIYTVEDNWHCSAILDDAIAERGFRRTVCGAPMIITFNDHKTTTHADVIKALNIGITECETRIKEGVLIDGKTLLQRQSERVRWESMPDN